MPTVKLPHFPHSGPVVGALCVGVWKQKGRSVELNQFGWTWDTNGVTPTGSFNLLLSLTVSPTGDSYQGTFDFRPFDVNRDFDPSGEQTGTVSATRITEDSPGPG